MLITLNPANNQWHAIMQITTSYHSTAVHPNQGDIFPFSSVLCCRDVSVSILTYLTVWERTALTVFLNTELVFSRACHSQRYWSDINTWQRNVSPPPKPSVAPNWPCMFSPSTVISNSTFIFVTILSATCIRSNPLAWSYFTYTDLSTCWRNIFPVNLPFWLK